MKYLFLSLIFYFTSSFTKQLDIHSPEEIINSEFLLTFPISGTNLTIGSIQAITRKPVLLIKKQWRVSHPGVNRLELDLNFDKLVLYRTHIGGGFFDKINQDKNKLLVVLRNYKECIPRACQYSEAEFKHAVLSEEGGFCHYIRNLRCFDRWKNPDTKLLIYYEDLILDLRGNVEKILQFLGEDITQMDQVFEDEKSFREKLIQLYRKQCPVKDAWSSGGDKLIYHSRNFKNESLIEMDVHIQKNYPNLWKKYLKRYKT